MTAVAERPRTAATRAAPDPRRELVGAVTTSAMLAAGTALALIEAVVLVAWATDGRSGAAAADAVRAGGLVWLAGHRIPLDVAGGQIALAPLGVTALVVLLLLRAGSMAAHRLRPEGAGRAAAVGALVGVPYAVVVFVMGRFAALPGARPSAFAALAAGLLVGGGCGAAGAVRAGSAARRAVRAEAQVVLRAATCALAVLVGTGAVGVALSLLAHRDRAAELTRAVQPGAAGIVVLLLICLVLVPNAVLWSAAYALGPGFALGAGTAVAPSGVHLGAVPSLPLLAVLPDTGAAPRISLLLLVGPVLAGWLAGRMVVRGLAPATPVSAAGWGASVGLATGAAVVVLSWLAGGGLGGGRLAAIGPAPLVVGLAAAAWVGGIGAATAAYRTWRGVA